MDNRDIATNRDDLIIKISPNSSLLYYIGLFYCNEIALYNYYACACIYI